MDLSLTITSTSIIDKESLSPGRWSQVFQYCSPDKETHQSRGKLFAFISLSCPNEQLDLENLARQAFAVLTQEYFKVPDGNITPALDNSLRQTQEKVSTLTQTLTQGVGNVRGTKLSLAVAVIWGDILYFRRLEQMEVALLRGGELVSYPFTPLGSEKLSNGDAVVLCTTDFWEKIGRQELARVLTQKPREEWENSLKEKIRESRDNSLMAAVVLSIQQREVPGEEEIIDIGVVEGKDEKKFMIDFVNKIRKFKFPLGLLTSFKLPKFSLSTPKIFLKKPSLANRSQKIALTGALGVLLVTAIISTYYYRTRVYNRRQQSALLEQVGELLVQGQAASSQNPQAATQYYREAGDILGQMTENERAQELSAELESMLATAYRLKEVNVVTALLWPKAALSRLFDLREDGVYTLENQNVLPRDEIWQNITAIDSFTTAYGENLYLLDAQASQIYKYISLPCGYSKRFSYFSIALDLNEAIGLTIDGAVYILFDSGEVHKYLGGEKQDFHLGGFYPSIEKAQAIFTSPETEHFYLASDDKILVFNKDGEYQRGFGLDEQFNGHLFVSDDEEKAWWGEGDEVHVADLR